MSALRSPQKNVNSEQPMKSPVIDSIMNSSLRSASTYYSDTDLKSIMNSAKSTAQGVPHHNNHHGSISSTASSSNVSQRHMPRPHHIHHSRHHKQQYHCSHNHSIHSLHSSQERRRSSVRNHGIPTLETVLENKSASPYSLYEFKNFMKRSHCFENYMFIKEVDLLLKFLREDGRPCCEASNLSREETEQEKYSVYAKEDPNNLSEKENLIRGLWSHILLVYITNCAEFEINLSGDIRDSLLSYNENCDDMSVHDIPIPEISAFVDAKDETYFLLQDAFLQFLKSVANKENNNMFVDKFDIYSKLQSFNSKNGYNINNISTAATIISRGSNHSNSTAESNSIVSLAQQALFNKNYCLTHTSNNNNNYFNGLVSPTYGDPTYNHENLSDSFASNSKYATNDSDNNAAQELEQDVHSPLSRKSFSSSGGPENILCKDVTKFHDENNVNDPINDFSNKGNVSAMNDMSKNIDKSLKVGFCDSGLDDDFQIPGMKEFIMNNTEEKSRSGETIERNGKPMSKSEKSLGKDTKQISNSNNNTGKNGINLTQLKKMGKKFRLF